jgi:hypothetical protein
LLRFKIPQRAIESIPRPAWRKQAAETRASKAGFDVVPHAFDFGDELCGGVLSIKDTQAFAPTGMLAIGDCRNDNGRAGENASGDRQRTAVGPVLNRNIQLPGQIDLPYLAATEAREICNTGLRSYLIVAENYCHIEKK